MQKDDKDLKNEQSVTKNTRFIPPPRPRTQVFNNNNFDAENKSTQNQNIENKNIQNHNVQTQNAEGLAHSEKPQKQKRELTEKQKKVIKKWSIIGAAILVFVVGLTVAIFSIVANAKANAKLEISAVGQISLIKDNNNKYFLAAPYQENADLYIFEIQEEGVSEVFRFENSDYRLSVTGLFSKSGNYQVRYAIQKANRPSTKSDFTEWKTVTSTEKLETPMFDYNPVQKQFSWQEVVNANAYQLFYYVESQLESVILTNEDFSVSDGLVTLKLEDLQLDLGVYEFTLIAVNTDANYFIPSDFNKKIVVKNFETLSPVKSALYNIENNVLFVTLNEIGNNLKLKISYNVNESIEINLEDGVLEHSFNLSKYNGLSFEATNQNKVMVSIVSSNPFTAPSNEIEIEFVN